MRPKRSASGAWTWMRLPHGQTVSTQSLLSRKANLVPSHLREAIEQRGTIRHHQPGDAAQHVGLSHRQVELAHADIDPHVAGPGIEEGVAGQAQAGDVVVCR
jgi:hypothetical protein